MGYGNSSPEILFKEKNDSDLLGGFQFSFGSDSEILI